MSLADQAARAFSIADLRTMSRRRLPRAIFEFYDGGAEDEIALRDNLEAFKRVRVLPRALNDVSSVDLSCDFVGGKAAMHMETLTEIALERCATARCAVKLMGELGVQYGFYGPEYNGPIEVAMSEAGEALTVSDPDETW